MRTQTQKSSSSKKKQQQKSHHRAQNSSSSSKSGSNRRTTNAASENAFGNNGTENVVFCFHVPERHTKIARTLRKQFMKANGSEVALFAVAVMCAFCVWLSRFDCFRVHMGLNGAYQDMEFKHAETVVEGYLDFHFSGTTKLLLDDYAQDILEANPDIQIEDLDLEIIISEKDFGANPLLMQPGGFDEHGGKVTVTKGATSVGRNVDEPTVVVTGEMILESLRKREASMPRPSSYSTTTRTRTVPSLAVGDGETTPLR